MFKNRECGYVQPLLWDHASGRLRESDGARVDAHLGRCATCRREAESFARTVQMVAADRQEGIGVPPAAWNEIALNLHVARKRPPRVSMWSTAWAGATLATLAAILLMFPRASHRDGVLPSGKNLGPQVASTSGGDKPRKGNPRTPVHGPNRSPAPPGASAGMNAPYREEPVRPKTPQVARSTKPQPAPASDLSYLDGRDTNLTTFWTGHRAAGVLTGHLPDGDLVGLRDDFIRVPLQPIAGDDKAVASAQRVQQEEAKVVDSRLFRRITIEEKGASLEEVCEILTKQTGVILRASRGVRDENATLFVKEMPARDVMRALARLFGYYWLRRGEEGSYQYELSQDLRSRLSEEETRNRDRNEALLALDDAIRQKIAKERAERKISPLQVYDLLSPGERAALAGGEYLEFTTAARDPDRRLPDAWRKPLLDSMNLYWSESSGSFSMSGPYRPDDRPLSEIPGAGPVVGLHIDRSELGELGLKITSGAYIEPKLPPGGGATPLTPIATGKSRTLGTSDNAQENAALRAQPLFQRPVMLKMQSSCPRFAPGAAPEEIGRQTAPEAAEVFYTDAEGKPVEGSLTPHLFSGNVWEAVHRATGLNVIADSYSRWYPASALTIERRPLFEALCEIGDVLGARWKKDGDFLLCRSVSFFWDKLKEVPKRSLPRWQEDSREHKGLPLEDLLEMAQLSDQQLDSRFVGQVIEHCWGIEEWGLVGSGAVRLNEMPGSQYRPVFRFLNLLSPEQLLRIQQPAGLGLEDLSPAQREAFPRGFLTLTVKSPAELASLRFRCSYAPAGRYVWRPDVKQDRFTEAQRWPLVTAETPEKTLSAARRLYPDAQPNEIKRSRGVFSITLTWGNGNVWRYGGPSISTRSK